MSTAQFGVVMALFAIGSLFVATLVAYLVTRANQPAWRSLHIELPNGLLLTSVFLLGLSGSLEYALAKIRRNNQPGLKFGLQLALVFAVGFLLSQWINWRAVFHTGQGAAANPLAVFSFFLLTGVHAAHVLAGFVPLALVYQRAVQREYSSSRYEGVKLCAQYWHFLGIVWLVLWVALATA
jgi:cytochrome c oxidase subunit 3